MALDEFSYEVKRIRRAVNYKAWQDGFHPVLLDTVKKIEQPLNYIHYNPKEAGFIYYEKDKKEVSNVNIVALW